MGGLLSNGAAVVAAVASVGAVALVVDQFTLRARLRRTEAWAIAMLGHDSEGERATALTNIRLDMTARIVAGILMPLRYFAEGVSWAVGAPGLVIITAMNGSASTSTIVTTAGIAFSGLAFAARRNIRLYLERSRIASEYRRGLPVTPARRGILDQMEGGTLVEFAYAGGLSAGICAFGLGAGSALSGQDVPGWPLALMVGGGCVAYGVLDRLRKHAQRRHPMR